MKLPIVKIPDPILRTKSLPVKKVTAELVLLAHHMLETMRASNGIGLAAPQIGRSIQLLVAGLSPTDDERESIPETILFNPRITKRSKLKTKLIEGCLSIPGLTGVVERSAAVTVTGLNAQGKSITMVAEGLHARVIQHEVDHLNGVLFTDRLVKYRVVFYGTSDFGQPALEGLIKHPQFDVVAVVTETDKPGGRGHRLIESPIKQCAVKNGMPIYQPSTLNTNHKDGWRAAEAVEFAHHLSGVSPDFQVVASYGKILPQPVLDVAAKANLNIHPSLLPKYRGATPIQSAILHGETKTGVCVMQMSAEMDAGPILSMYEYMILASETAGELTARLAKAAATQLISTLEDWIADKTDTWMQDETKATYTAKIGPETARIDWLLPPKNIVNHIRAMSPKPGAYTEINGQMVKILRAQLSDGAIMLGEILIPGKKPMSMTDLKNGYRTIHTHLKGLAQKKA